MWSTGNSCPNCTTHHSKFFLYFFLLKLKAIFHLYSFPTAIHVQFLNKIWKFCQVLTSSHHLSCHQFGSSSQVIATAAFLLFCFYLGIFPSVDWVLNSALMTILKNSEIMPVLYLCSCADNTFSPHMGNIPHSCCGHWGYTADHMFELLSS